MIFVTVGTHEQQFDRLVSCVDALKRDGIIREDVMIQTGFSTYEPQYCRWSKLIPYEEMVRNVEEARIVITHGGPASFLMPLQIGKIPIVVPRQSGFEEHVNDHQLDFAIQVEERMGNIILVRDVDLLAQTILDYDRLAAERQKDQSSNNVRFCAQLAEQIGELFPMPREAL